MRNLCSKNVQVVVLFGAALACPRSVNSNVLPNTFHIHALTARFLPVRLATMEAELRFDGQVAVITGAGGGECVCVCLSVYVCVEMGGSDRAFTGR